MKSAEVARLTVELFDAVAELGHIEYAGIEGIGVVDTIVEGVVVRDGSISGGGGTIDGNVSNSEFFEGGGGRLWEVGLSSS